MTKWDGDFPGNPAGYPAGSNPHDELGDDSGGGWGLLPVALILALIVEPFLAAWRLITRPFRRQP